MLEKKPEQSVPAKILNPRLCYRGVAGIHQQSEPRQNSSGGINQFDPTTIVEHLFLIVNTFCVVCCTKFSPPQQSEGGKHSISNLVVLPIPAIPPVGDTLKL